MHDRTCRDCGKTKPIDQYYRKRGGHLPWCMACEKARSARRRKRRKQAARDIGPVDGVVYSYEQIGAHLGISPQSVERIERRAMLKLALTCVKEGIRP